MNLQPKLRYSVVVPVHNEQDDVEELTRRIDEAFQDSYEIIFVDDGSTDATWERLLALREAGRVRLIRFRRNFGKAAALMAGFQATRGELVFTMDGDLQDDPAEAPRFVAALESGYDLVSGWKKRRHDPGTKVLASRIFNFVVRKTTGVDLHDMNCGYKIYRGELAREVRIYGELHRFIPALASWRGYRVGEIEVQHRPRLHGRSKYGMSRLFKGFVDLVTALVTAQYGARPAHGFGWAALGAGSLGVVSFGAMLPALGLRFEMIGGADIALWPPLLGLALFFGLSAVILMAAGWVAEVAVAGRLRDDPASLYSIEERLD